MQKKKLPKHKAAHVFLVIITVLLVIALITGMAFTWHERNLQASRVSQIQAQATQLGEQQSQHDVHVFSASSLQSDINTAHSSVVEFRVIKARAQIKTLEKDITNYRNQLSKAILQKEVAEEEAKSKAEAEAVAVATSDTITLPILLYHKPPADFERQMQTLKDKGYSTIHMQDYANFLAGKEVLPAKPVVITFDDGFSVQQDILPILQKHSFKATLYLIEGGEMSHWCIGILRKNFSCGDSYMGIANVNQMLGSGLIEIGDHTVDHPNLNSMNEASQYAQLTQSKTFLEQTFGRPISTLAYPYGAFNAITLRLAAQAGYTTAVTTIGGIVQTKSQPLQLHRVRDTYVLP